MTQEFDDKRRNPASNSCVRCRFEDTCGYSTKATLGERTETSFEPCCLGERSYGKGPFFELRRAA